MKNLTKTLFAALVAAVVLTSSAATTFAAEPVKMETSALSAKDVTRIRVSGNVRVILTQGSKEQVVGTSNYDPANTSVMTDGRTIFINSAEPGLVTLSITVKDLQRVEAFGNSVVVTSNNFDVKNLQVFLNDNATANIKTTAESLYTVINDDAKLKLNGKADESTMITSKMKNVRLAKFSSDKSELYASEAIMNAHETALARTK